VHLFVIGAGRIGLVTAVGFADLGHRVTVTDVDAERIAMLQTGRVPVFEPGLDEGVGRRLADGRLDFSLDPRPPGGASVSFITVSTPVGPDGPLSLKNVEDVVTTLLDQVETDHVIVIRSTLPIDGPDRLLAVAGRPSRAAIVTNPEFLREGAALADFARPDRVVVGWLTESDREAAESIAGLYATLGAPAMIADARSVALIKVASNVLLAAKVAYADELARICDAVGADVDTVADGIGLDRRLGRAFLTAGPGFGGSCLPDQAVALAELAETEAVAAPLIAAVARSNEAHQRAIAEDIGRLVGARRGAGLDGARIAILGLAFKARTDDVRRSPALSIAALLRDAGASVVATDPRAIDAAKLADARLETAPTPAEAATDADAVVIVTEWPEYRDLDWAELAARMSGDLVYDTRAIVDGERVRAAGLRFASLGRQRAAALEPAAAGG
jgi:UDPglucose 6-dehydrogenase